MSISETNIKKNAAFRGVVEATQIFREIYGPHDLRTLLEQELTRETVLAEIAARRKPPIADVAAGAADAGQPSHLDDGTAELLQRAIAALSFYADSSNYDRRGPKASFIASDKGDVAREALQVIDTFIASKADSSNG